MSVVKTSDRIDNRVAAAGASGLLTETLVFRDLLQRAAPALRKCKQNDLASEIDAILAIRA